MRTILLALKSALSVKPQLLQRKTAWLSRFSGCLYPQRVQVNDQMSRLRRILALNVSSDWQRRQLSGNLIHFGSYTSLTQPTRGPDSSTKRQQFEEYLQHLEEEWDSLTPELRETGNWPVVSRSEMLCRWDMQGAPPDILVTNYSMLEYMLIRPIESPVFDITRDWLAGGEDRTITLVLDEAHTYTGAKGTEVAHLVRRLKERLGIQPGSGKFQAIATSASIPSAPGAEDALRKFTLDLFAEPADKFTIIHAGVADEQSQVRTASTRSFTAFGRFQDAFVPSDPWPGIRELAKSLEATVPDETLDPQVALFQTLADNEDLKWVRARTARNATKKLKAENEKDENAAPIIRKVLPASAEPNPLEGKVAVTLKGRPAVVEYEPDTDLRDAEQVPLLHPGGIKAFLKEGGPALRTGRLVQSQCRENRVRTQLQPVLLQAPADTLPGGNPGRYSYAGAGDRGVNRSYDGLLNREAVRRRMEIQHCCLCGKVLTSDNNTEEHIIPNAIGGRKRVVGFICRDCNSRSGERWDAELVRQLAPLCVLLGITRQRGHVSPQTFRTFSGGSVRINPDRTMVRRRLRCIMAFMLRKGLGLPVTV